LLRIDDGAALATHGQDGHIDDPAAAVEGHHDERLVLTSDEEGEDDGYRLFGADHRVRAGLAHQEPENTFGEASVVADELNDAGFG
jgi:di/tripeptidase